LSSLIIPKKNNTICFLSDFWEVKKRLVRKTCPIPKISLVLQVLERFFFATALDINMVITPLDWIQMHPKSVPFSFLRENIPTSNYQQVLQILQTFFKEKRHS
jgi:hypothetical protein